DPDMKSGFWKVCISLGMSEDLSRKSQWKTWKQMMEKYTESEVEEMVEHGSIKVRKNPRNPTRKQWLDHDEAHTKSFRRRREDTLEGSKAITGDEFKQLHQDMTKKKMIT
ncbi:unnamed protein product, partial [Prorocentrum cordatum]